MDTNIEQRPCYTKTMPAGGVLRVSVLLCLISLITVVPLFAFDEDAFYRALERHDISSEFDAYFATVADRVAKDEAYNPAERRFYAGYFADVKTLLKRNPHLVRTCISAFMERTEETESMIRAYNSGAQTNDVAALQARAQVGLRLYAMLYMMLADAGFYDDAFSVLYTRFAESPLYHDGVVLERIEQFYAQERYEQYIALYSLLQNETNKEGLRAHAGHAYFVLGSYDSALTTYAAVARSIPLHRQAPMTLYDVGYIHFARKAYDESLRHFLALRDTYGGEYARKAFYYAGVIYILTGDSRFEGFVRSSGDPASIYLLATHAFLKGKYEDALAYYEQSMSRSVTLAQNDVALRQIDVLTDNTLTPETLLRLDGFLRALLEENGRSLVHALISLIEDEKVPVRIRLLYTGLFCSIVTPQTATACYTALEAFQTDDAYLQTTLTYVKARIEGARGNALAARELYSQYVMDAPAGLFAYDARTRLTQLRDRVN